MAQVRSQFVRKMAAKVLKESKMKNPPVDLKAIVQAHGLEYEEIDTFPDTVDALIIDDGSKIYAAVNAKHHIHRCRFSLAHELGHHFLHQDGVPEDPITIDNPPSEDDEIGTKAPGEAEADLFAGELLVPLQMLKAHRGKSIPELSKIFQVSEQVISIAISRHMRALYK